MTRSNQGPRALVALAAALVASAPAMAGNLIANGTFSATPSLDGWVVARRPQSYIQIKAGAVGNVVYIKDAPVTLSQTFADTAGQKLSIQADYLLQQSNPNQPFSVLFDGQQVFSTTSLTGGWKQLDIDVLATGSDTLSFDFHTQNLRLSTAMELGNVSVQPSAVPEPAPVLMVGLGLAAMAWVARRRREGARARPASTN